MRKINVSDFTMNNGEQLSPDQYKFLVANPEPVLAFVRERLDFNNKLPGWTFSATDSGNSTFYGFAWDNWEQPFVQLHRDEYNYVTVYYMHLRYSALVDALREVGYDRLGAFVGTGWLLQECAVTLRRRLNLAALRAEQL